MGHVLVENRQRLTVEAVVTAADATAKADAALLVAEPLPQWGRLRLSGHQAYDTKSWLGSCASCW